ncbi:MAG: SCO family protein [Anaerolineales bacterium]|nr:SCO family protein [Anaerolineales bacterium]MCX7609794.1 SCO family protein [Anaerolineales bacterium]MDW8228005.1 SCO family protein [Anaerolineales bacterium]
MFSEPASERTFLWVGLSILLILVLAIGLVLLTRQPTYRGVLYDPPVAAPDFTLYTVGGREVHLSDFRGKIVLLFFGYTTCPDICPTTLAVLRQVYAGLGKAAEHVQVLYVTVDPERDNPDRVQEYVSFFQPAFLGLSGSLEALEPVWQAYGVTRIIEPAPASAAGYFVTHSTRLYLIDQEGQLFLSYSYGTPPEDILHDLQELLK